MTCQYPHYLGNVGDLNQDCKVDGADYTLLADCMGDVPNPTMYCETADFNRDGQVDGADFTIWQDHYGDQVVEGHPPPPPPDPVGYPWPQCSSEPPGYACRWVVVQWDPASGFDEKWDYYEVFSRTNTGNWNLLGTTNLNVASIIGDDCDANQVLVRAIRARDEAYEYTQSPPSAGIYFGCDQPYAHPVPEPGLIAGLLSGVVLLALLGRLSSGKQRAKEVA